jgi:tetratricopeptide (TPR) repeat protein
LGYTFDINVITEPTKEFIDSNIDSYNKRVNYDKYNEIEDKDFNALIQPLNSCQISNIEKHREIYKNIMNKSNDEIYFIIEDDVVIGQEYAENIETLLKRLKNNTLDDWDILFTCLPSMNQEGQMSISSTRDIFNTLISKSSYFIKPNVCKKLYEYTNTFKFTLKNAISRFIYENKDVKSMYLNKHTFLEGSKIGIVPTTVNPSNFLFQNNQYIHLTNISNRPNITDKDVNEAEKICESAKHVESADIYHIMGIIYYKNNDYENAKKNMTTAVDILKKKKGYLYQNSEILNNCINMFQYEQPQLEDCKKTIPKYS